MNENINYIQISKTRNKKVDKYIVNKMAYPDKGSVFDKKLGNTKYALRTPIIKNIVGKKVIDKLMNYDYDMIVASIDNKFIGHVAGQKQNDNIFHVFSVYVVKDYRGDGIATKLVDKAIDSSREKKLSGVRLGAGGHDSMDAILKKYEGKDNYKVSENNFLIFI